MTIVDANIVLRYILNDHEELSSKAADILEHQLVTLPVETACEVVYVLQKVYQVDRPEIHRCLGQLIEEQIIAVEKPEVLLKALDCFSSTKLDFVDTLLWAYHLVEKQDVLTFDVALDKYIQQNSAEF